MAKRRRVLALFSGTLISGLVLSGCLGNPPSRDGTSTGSASIPTPVASNANLEVKTISLGYIPILEAAPLVIGVEKGFFAKHGLEVNLSKQASWGAARDNLVLGAAGGGIDGGQWQLPMPQMISEGAITNGKKVPMVILAMLMSQGNGIAASNAVKDGNLTVDLKTSSPGFFDKFSQKQGRKIQGCLHLPQGQPRDLDSLLARCRWCEPRPGGGTTQGAGTGNPAGHEERHDGGLLHR